MDILEIIKNSVKYPFSDIKTLVIIGVLFLISSIFLGLGNIVNNSIVGIVGIIISIIITLILVGYQLNVIKFGVEQSDKFPSLDIKNNIIDGIKLIIVNIVYYIIPAIIVSIIAFISGGFAVFNGIITNEAFNQINSTAAGNSTNVALASNSADFALGAISSGIVSAIAITAVIAVILFIIFGLLALMGQARLAKTGSLGDALSIGASFKDLKKIGILKTLALIILLGIVIAIIVFILVIIAFIPVIGTILVLLFGEAIIMFIQSRATGLLYSELE